jgi:hypothetical protein
MSDYLEGEVIKHIFRTGSFTKPTVLAVALCTAATSDSQTGATITEVPNSGSYARATLNPLDANWTAPGAGGLTDNAAEIAFTAATGSWGTVTHIAICDSATWGAGNVLLHGALTVSKTVNSGDTFKFAIGALDVTFA